VASEHTGVIELFMMALFSIHGLEENKVLPSDLSLEQSTQGVRGEGEEKGKKKVLFSLRK